MKNFGELILKSDIKIQFDVDGKWASFDCYLNEDGKEKTQNFIAINSQAEMLDGLKAGQVLKIQGNYGEDFLDKNTVYVSACKRVLNREKEIKLTKMGLIGNIQFSEQNSGQCVYFKLSCGDPTSENYELIKGVAFDKNIEQFKNLKEGQEISVKGKFNENSRLEVLEVKINQSLSQKDQSLLTAVNAKDFIGITEAIKNGADIKTVTSDHLKNYSTGEKELFKVAAKEGICEFKINQLSTVDTISSSVSKGVKM